MDPIVLGLIVVVALNMLIFPIAYKLQTDQLTDITYALSFTSIAVYGYIAGVGSVSMLKVALFGLVILWAVRLGYFLLIRVRTMGGDALFDQIMTNPKRFFRFFMIQGVSSWIISLPFLFRLIDNAGTEAGWSDIATIEWIGLGLAALGLIIESVADHQKSAFKDIKGNSDKLFKAGLYKVVQFPNYTGEILFWIGIFIASLTAISGVRWLVISSPIIIILLLVFLSGIPPIIKSRKKRYADNPEYQAYVSSTSKLIPGIY